MALRLRGQVSMPSTPVLAVDLEPEPEPGPPPPPPTTTKEIRLCARATVTEASVMADVSPTTWRVYEASRDAVSAPIQVRCDAVVAKLLDLAHAHAHVAAGGF